MKLQAEVSDFLKFCNEHKQEVKDFYEKVVASKCYVKSPVDFVAYDLIRYYCYVKYNTKTYCILYDKYDANDNNVLTLAKQGLKSINII